MKEIIDFYDIPEDIREAAHKVSCYFKEQDIESWELMDLANRNAVTESYNRGIDTAISLVKEYSDYEMRMTGVTDTLVCGLESSKKEI